MTNRSEEVLEAARELMTELERACEHTGTEWMGSGCRNAIQRLHHCGVYSRREGLTLSELLKRFKHFNCSGMANASVLTCSMETGRLEKVTGFVYNSTEIELCTDSIL